MAGCKGEQEACAEPCSVLILYNNQTPLQLNSHSSQPYPVELKYRKAFALCMMTASQPPPTAQHCSSRGTSGQFGCPFPDLMIEWLEKLSDWPCERVWHTSSVAEGWRERGGEG
jgi:hypothetical protein